MTYYDQATCADYSHTIYFNVKISVRKNEICPLCLNGFIDTKNIVVPDCGHSMHINCFCRLYDNKLIHCSICKLQIIEKKESNIVCPFVPERMSEFELEFVPEFVSVRTPVSTTVPTPAPAPVPPTPAPTHMSPTDIRARGGPHWDRLEVSRIYPSGD